MTNSNVYYVAASCLECLALSRRVFFLSLSLHTYTKFVFIIRTIHYSHSSVHTRERSRSLNKPHETYNPSCSPSVHPSVTFRCSLSLSLSCFCFLIHRVHMSEPLSNTPPHMFLSFVYVLIFNSAYCSLPQKPPSATR